MELWIRSQDKELLMKASDIALKEKTIVGYFDKETEYEYLGTYKTKKRALEILDEIQNILNLKDMYKYDRELVLKSWGNFDEEQVKIVRQQMSVYEMPKE